jgi:hypothetical protein
MHYYIQLKFISIHINKPYKHFIIYVVNMSRNPL